MRLRTSALSYARDNGRCGLTTLLREHITCRTGAVEFDFPAKSGEQILEMAEPPALSGAPVPERGSAW